ncbi:transcriptional regulator [Paenibacillus sp. CAA11]|uniref:helix-turn-helix domain-containing protein n=1 Tax=Paenibacillus sp. CAA11 TaxID=1532905 RepID=UPI000D34CE4D|nr:helix-turn-helix transcriptional regulator [Paenibacillus sp. CAA11]AWB45305.1 transcriptional regulator [Paenibacillus sp. CAA11]
MLIVTPCLGEILKERGITQTQLSQMSGVPQGSISRFDKNTRHEDAHLFAISRVLNVSIEELFTLREAE